MNKEKVLMLIDSYALIYRAYYAFPPNLTTSKGEPINAVYGFSSLLLDVIIKHKPNNIIALGDSNESTIKQTEHTFYKANRQKADDLFVVQLPKVAEVLDSLDIPFFQVPGIEADDLIGTIAANYADNYDKIIIVTGDQDIFQLVNDKVFVFMAGRKFSESKLFTAQDVFNKLGVYPKNIIDYKGIYGDTSDNIPGVKGIGEKGAVDLITQFGTIEEIYKNIEQVPNKYKQKLVANYEMATVSKKLATIHQDIPLSVDIDKACFDSFNYSKANNLFTELGFKSLFPKLKIVNTFYNGNEATEELPAKQEAQKADVAIWEESNVPSKEIFIQFKLNNDKEDSLTWELAEIYFKSLNKKEIYKVESTNIDKFLSKLNTKENTIIVFDSKRFRHSLINKKLDILANIKDLGIYGFVLSEGLANATQNSTLNFYGFQPNEEVENNLQYYDKLWEKLVEKCKASENLSKLIDLEHELLPGVMVMERNGIKLDVPKVKEYEKILSDKKQGTVNRIYQNVGYEFNLNSPKQVSDALFVKKGLSSGAKTKGGSLSTNEKTLRSLIGEDPVIEEILNYREIDKLLSTYVKVLPDYVNPKTQRIHAEFDQSGAVSGRFSSKNPNLQNIPKGETQEINMRNSFVAPEGKTFLAFDYSQQELRILAAFSGDEIMIESFNNGDDIHKITAAELFNVPLEEVTSKQRDMGKTVNFSVVYGISAFGLSERLGIDRATASEFIDKYFNKYPKVKEYFNQILHNISVKGYSETALGRRRTNAMIKSNNRNFRQAAERELINFVIQGTAADIMKLAMIQMCEKLSKNPNVLLLAQIHDEFLLEYDVKNNYDINRAEIKDFVQEMSDIMLNAYDIGVKFKVDPWHGIAWGSMIKFN